MQTETLPEHKKSKMYKGHEVDFELKESWLNRLNKIVAVTSVCAGHPDGIGALGAGGFSPSFIFKIPGWDEAQELFDAFGTIPNTEIEWFTWAGPNKNWVTYSNGEPRLDVYSQEQIDNLEISYHNIAVKSRIRHNGRNQERLARWWRAAIKAVENFYDNRG